MDCMIKLVDICTCIYLSKYNIGQGILQHSGVSIIAEESRVVVIVQEVTQDGDIRKDRVLSHTIVNIPHSLLLLEGIVQLVVHWVVECGGQRALVACYILRVPIENLSHCEHTSLFRVL